MSRTRSLTLPALLVAAAMLAGACTPAAAKPTWTFQPGTGGGAAAPAATTPGTTSGAPTSGEVLGTVELTAFDMGFQPAHAEVDKPGRYQVKLTNTGTIPHDMTFASGETATAQPGGTATLEVDVPAAGSTSSARSRVMPRRAWKA